MKSCENCLHFDKCAVSNRYYHSSYHTTWYDSEKCNGYLDMEMLREQVKLEKEVANSRMEYKELKDYQFRMIKEYRELKEKYEKLHKMLIKCEAKTLDFELKCPYSLLEEQARLMGEYLHILEVRAEIEGIGYDDLLYDRVESLSYDNDRG